MYLLDDYDTEHGVNEGWISETTVQTKVVTLPENRNVVNFLKVITFKMYLLQYLTFNFKVSLLYICVG